MYGIHGPKWPKIAEELNFDVGIPDAGKRIRSHFKEWLDPNLCHDDLTADEIALLNDLVAKHEGSDFSWKVFSDYLAMRFGRMHSPGKLKNWHYNNKKKKTNRTTQKRGKKAREAEKPDK